MEDNITKCPNCYPAELHYYGCSYAIGIEPIEDIVFEGSF